MYGRLTIYLCFRKSFGGAALVSSCCQHESIKVRGTISTLLVATTLLSGNMYKLGRCLVGDSHGTGFHIFTGYWGSGNISVVYIALWLVITTHQRSYGKVLFSVVSVRHSAHSGGGGPHMAITYDALDLTVQDLPLQTWDHPGPLLVTSGGPLTGMFSCSSF